MLILKYSQNVELLLNVVNSRCRNTQCNLLLSHIFYDRMKRPFDVPLVRFRSSTLMMASTIAIPRSCIQAHRSLVHLNFHLSALQSSLLPIAKRHASNKTDQSKKKKKARASFIQYSLKDAEQYSLCDAMRYKKTLQNSLQSLAD